MMNRQTAMELLTQGNLTLVGQQVGNNPGSSVDSYDRLIGDLVAMTGRTPAILGAGYWGGDNADYDALHYLLGEHAEAGGLSTFYLRKLTNPWTLEEDHHTLRPSGHRLIELITRSSSVYYRWMSMLDTMIRHLDDIRDLVGLWRPFHECTYYENAWWNSDWSNEATHERDYADFNAVWRHWREYFDAAGLTNLIWVYSTANRTNPPASALYPGPEYAELCGPSVASPWGLTDGYLPPAPLVFGEARHRSDEPVSLIDYYLPWLEEHHPGYALWWPSYTGHPLALVDAPDAKEFMEHPLTVTLEDLAEVEPEPEPPVENWRLELARLYRESADVLERAADGG